MMKSSLFTLLLVLVTSTMYGQSAYVSASSGISLPFGNYSEVLNPLSQSNTQVGFALNAIEVGVPVKSRLGVYTKLFYGRHHIDLPDDVNDLVDLGSFGMGGAFIGPEYYLHSSSKVSASVRASFGAFAHRVPNLGKGGQTSIEPGYSIGGKITAKLVGDLSFVFNTDYISAESKFDLYRTSLRANMLNITAGLSISLK